ncbi:MAG TPA: glycosyltransferase family 1 protein [Anaerolineaceae bacterium]|nr:glycosyltransferase family 1 protein [Anaerolineaceae bacterium]HPN50458.1 glycosyltransferase family 1 protein [Anaerolineaceae bacterium]
MKIGLDLSVTKYERAGTTTYAVSLWEAMKAGYPMDRFETFMVNHPDLPNGQKTFSTRMATLYRDLCWTPLILPAQASRAKLDVLHMPAQMIPLFRPCPVVVTFHDLFVLDLPHYFPLFHRLSARILMPRAARRADAIIAVSDYTRKELERRFNIDPAKIHVTYEAAAPHFRLMEQAKIAAAREKYALPERFILSVGTLQPRKNITCLLEALTLLNQRGIQVQLIHAGSRGWLTQSIDETISRLNLQHMVRFMGRMPLEDLVALYNAASVFAYPSLYEGFGLPPLEAMACGCPVITSNTTSLPEVVGDAGLLADPRNPEDLAAALEKILIDPALAENLKEKGLQRAKEFSWARCAEQTYQVYRKVAG